MSTDLTTRSPAAGRPAPAAGGPSRPAGINRIRIAKRAGWAVVYVVVLIAAWGSYVKAGKVPSYLLPSPNSVWHAFLDLARSGQLWPNLGYTVGNIVLGFAGGSLIGVLLGWVISTSSITRELLGPYLVLLQAAPKIAVAPLLVLWFGLNRTSQLSLILLLVFFPMMLSTLLGLADVGDDLADLGNVLALSRLLLLRRIQIPAALPAVFAGAKIAIVDAMTGAFLAEYLSAQKGLGYLMVLGNTSFNAPLLVTAVILTVLVGLFGFGLLALLEGRVLRWRD